MEYILGILILLVVFLIAFSKTPKGKGIIGELKVKLILGKTKKGEKYVLNNILFDTDTKSCQIDHILINKNGVFVIETKNYSGRIYGTDKEHEWTQVLQYGKVKNRFYSPVKQNQTHIYEIKKVIGNDVPIKSLIVFVQGNTKYITSDYVCTLGEIKTAVREEVDKTLSLNEMEDIYNKILDLSKSSSTTNKEHVENINKMKEDIDNNICPRCGGNLIEKTSKHGTFYGCENYPKCKFTKKQNK